MNADLFAKQSQAHYGDSADHRNLFIQRLLNKEASFYQLRDDSQRQAYEILCKWADLELKGKLAKKKETSLQAEFLTDVFGNALGYTLFSEDLDRWNLEAQYNVNGGTADAAIGVFESDKPHPPVALIELKGPRANLDRDRSRGRTAVQQCWDYLNMVPDCPWGIACNYVSFRLYHRNHTPKAYQLFLLSELKNEETFRKFYYLFQRNGLLAEPPDKHSRADLLLIETGERQQEVGNELYEYYDERRYELIGHLTKTPYNKPLDMAIRIAQTLIDRIMFVAFCEDRGLLPADSIGKAYEQIAPFDRVTNPKWRNFLALFESIDKGNPKRGIPPYNGGLFKRDPDVDDLQLDDNWADFFRGIGKYDFRDEVNVEVLGNLFERSIPDLERIRTHGLLGTLPMDSETPKMKKSAKRKRLGVYYTPRDFTQYIVQRTVGDLIRQRFAATAKKHGVEPTEVGATEPEKRRADYWRECYETLRSIRIVDPACGSGAFLIAAYELLESLYEDIMRHISYHAGEDFDKLRQEISDHILCENLHGVDLSEQAVEITRLALWLRSAKEAKPLADLSENIVCGNSLVSDPEIDPLALDWESTFPKAFSDGGFDCVIGNPPWERMKLQEREFFDAASPEIASAVNAATRRELIAELKKTDPQLHERYEQAKTYAEKMLAYVRGCRLYPLTGRGDINTYAIFAELAHTIVAPTGRVGILVPSGIATDDTTKEFFGELTNSGALVGLYDFENKAPVFADVHRSFKFCILLFSGGAVQSTTADFVFFAHRRTELDDKKRHISLSPDDIKLLNPNTRTCPIFRSQRDAELTEAIYKRVPVLIDKNREEGGNPWSVKFLRMFDQTNDAELFHTAEQLKKARFKREGDIWKKGKKTFLPLYEAKMVQMYDHRAASVVIDPDNWMRQGQTRATLPVEHQNPEFSAEPRWWADRVEVTQAFAGDVGAGQIAFKDVTSATNQRTMIAALIPDAGLLNSAPLLLLNKGIGIRTRCAFLSNLNSFVLDYVARQKVGGLHLNFFIVEQLPILAPDSYQEKCPWDKRTTLEEWVSDRVLKLTCTANDMIPLAEAAGFDPPVHQWKPAERADLMAQLDAAYFLLYGIERDDVEYILSTFQGVAKEELSLLETSGTVDRILKYYDQYQKSARG